MIIDEYGLCVFNEQEIISGLYTGQIFDMAGIYVDNTSILEKFNKSVDDNFDNFHKLSEYKKPTCTVEEFDQIRQHRWFIPVEYETFDIKTWLISQCDTPEKLCRVEEELDLLSSNQNIQLLIYLKYLVDLMRERKIVWGVGRGSSVACYCLYLIGVHKIDSIKYGLNIRDFIKEK